MKVARPVWGGGKGGDNFKALPITIGNFYENEQCCGSGFQRFPEGYGYAYENPVYQRKKSGKGRHYGNGNPSVKLNGGTLCDAVISAGKAASRKGDLPF